MRRKELHWFWYWLAFGILYCASVACSSPGPQPDTPALAVLIDNKGFYDADVYVLSNDVIVRKVGVVDGLSTQRYTLTGWQFMPGQQIAFYARTIAEGRQYRSDLITIPPGRGLRWTLDAHGEEWLVPFSKAH